MPLIPDSTSPAQCLATRLATGIYGTAEISQVLLNCAFAMDRTPASFARRQLAAARGPGPTTDIEYSPTSVATPPRSIGMLHSLTLSRRVSRGSLGISSRHISSGQPQSQTITSACLLDRRTPAQKTAPLQGFLESVEG